MPDFDRGSEDFRKAVRGRFPNPNRLGCPPPEIIDALAHHTLSPDHPAAEHLVTCSPCYEQFLATRRKIRRSRSLRMAGIAALIFALAGGAAYLVISVKKPRVFQFARAAVPYTLDLRYTSPNRGIPSGAPSLTSPVVLPPKHLNLTIYLPLGWEPGSYEIQLLNAKLRAVVRRQASAVFSRHILTIATDFDLSKVPSGKYSLAMRTGRNGWRVFAITIP